MGVNEDKLIGITDVLRVQEVVRYFKVVVQTRAEVESFFRFAAFRLNRIINATVSIRPNNTASKSI